jgi:hypothetical protein
VTPIDPVGPIFPVHPVGPDGPIYAPDDGLNVANGKFDICLLLIYIKHINFEKK